MPEQAAYEWFRHISEAQRSPKSQSLTSQHMQQHPPQALTRRQVLVGTAATTLFAATSTMRVADAANNISPWAEKLIAAARTQIGVTLEYDGAYVALKFPGGDIPRVTGVCTDVIIRAYRDAFNFDLQRAVNADMRRNFRAYPKRWGLKRPDRNIDHRRVPNLQTFFKRHDGKVPGVLNAANYRPGDMITQVIGGRLPHIGIISDRKGATGRPLMIHNIGAGTREEDVTASFPVTGHYRFNPEASASG